MSLEHPCFTTSVKYDLIVLYSIQVLFCQVLFDAESEAYYGHNLLLPLLMTGQPFDSLVKVSLL